jgi:hypothetical protein
VLNTPVLEVAIGLVFCYAAVGLIVSSINEAIASVLKLRAVTLLNGIKQLLNDPNFEGLARDVYNHALVNPRHNGQAQKEEDLSYKPSYIPSMHFANALIDVLQQGCATAAKLDQALAAIQDPQLRQLLLGMYARAAGNLERLQNEFAAWFDNGMERVAGQYKRRTQLICVVIAFVIAATFNIDSFHLFKTLWDNAGFAVAATASSAPNVLDAVAGLQTLPIGWSSFPPQLTPAGYFLMFIGWLVTASSALFGAPFWFDLLQNITQLRGTGRKPSGAARRS